MKPTLLMYIVQNLQGHFESFISFLNSFSDTAFLIPLGTKYPDFGAREDMVSVTKYTERLHIFFRVELFLRL